MFKIINNDRHKNHYNNTNKYLSQGFLKSNMNETKHYFNEKQGYANSI